MHFEVLFYGEIRYSVKLTPKICLITFCMASLITPGTSGNSSVSFRHTRGSLFKIFKTHF
jgi:hypothetical protein